MSDLRTGGVQYQTLSAAELKSMPIDVAAFYLAISQTESLDNQIKDRLETIRAKQTEISEARDILARMKALKEQAGKGTADMPADMKTWLQARGIKIDANRKKEGWDINMEYVNNYVKNLNSAVELDMLNIQSMMSKRGQALQMSSDIMKKSNESKDAIIRNI